MAKTNAENVAAYRARQKRKLEARIKYESALQQILTMLDGNEKPMAVKLRAVAEEGLA